MEVLELVKGTAREGEGEGRGRGKGGGGEGWGRCTNGVADPPVPHTVIRPVGAHLNLTTLRPLGRMMSGLRFSRCSASSAVTSETVLRMCVQCAAARSRQ